jgi:hypothetical protein
MYRTTLALLAVFALSACSTMPSQEIINDVLQATVNVADARFQEGDVPESAVLIHAVSRIDADYPGVADLQTKLGPVEDQVTNRGRLGINRRLRTRDDPVNPLLALVMYAPDRVFDLLDLVTLDVHFGPGVFADVHVTRRIQAAGGLRAIMGVGAHDQRSIGLKNQSEAGVSVLTFGTQTVAGTTVGTSGVHTGSESMIGLHSPNNTLYQDFRDFWAIGVSVTAGLAGAEVDIHPVQLFDFIGGILFLDFSRDDFGTTRGLRLSGVENDLLRNLAEIERAKLWEGRRQTAAVVEPEPEPAPAETESGPEPASEPEAAPE